MTLPTHLSYSSLKQYEECPRSWYLSKLKKAPEKQTWFLPMGTAVHTSIEEFVKTGKVPEFEGIFYPLIEAQLKADDDDVNWSAAGPKDRPVIRQRAVDLGKACVDKAIDYLDGFEVWQVEWNASTILPGCEVEIWAFIDLIGEHKKHGPMILDWKTGKRKPKNNLQLEVYRALLMQDEAFSEIKTGAFGMINPDASKARPVDLSKVDALTLGLRFQTAYQGMRDKKYKAVLGYDCTMCLQAPNCLAYSWDSKQARNWDKSEDEGVPF